MLKRVILVLLSLSIIPTFVLASDPVYKIKITEFIPNPVGSDSTEEWIEIHNEGEEVNIGGLYLTDKEGSVKKYIIPPDTVIKNDEYLAIYSTDTKISLNNDGDGIALFESNDSLIDETEVSGPSKEGYSYAFFNTEWQWTKTPTPGAKNIITLDEPEEEEKLDPKTEEKSEPEYTKNAKLLVTEFLPNPQGSDTNGEWIEIYNGGGLSNISGYIIADKIGSPKEYKIPKGTTIGPEKYLVFYSSKTPISLNNDGDAIEIKDPTGKIIDSSGTSCGKGNEGESYAYNGSKWEWTSNPTPGSRNIIAASKKSNDDKNNKEKTEVMGDISEFQFQEEEKEIATKNDQLLGYILIVVAIIGGISYTLYINREYILEKFFKKRRRNNKDWEKLRRKSEGE